MTTATGTTRARTSFSLSRQEASFDAFSLLFSFRRARSPRELFKRARLRLCVCVSWARRRERYEPSEKKKRRAAAPPLVSGARARVSSKWCARARAARAARRGARRGRVAQRRAPPRRTPATERPAMSRRAVVFFVGRAKKRGERARLSDTCVVFSLVDAAVWVPFFLHRRVSRRRARARSPLSQGLLATGFCVSRVRPLAKKYSTRREGGRGRGRGG